MSAVASGGFPGQGEAERGIDSPVPRSECQPSFDPVLEFHPVLEFDAVLESDPIFQFDPVWEFLERPNAGREFDPWRFASRQFFPESWRQCPPIGF